MNLYCMEYEHNGTSVDCADPVSPAQLLVEVQVHGKEILVRECHQLSILYTLNVFLRCTSEVPGTNKLAYLESNPTTCIKSRNPDRMEDGSSGTLVS